MRADLLPAPLRAGVFAAAVAAMLYITLSPTDRLPDVSVWDKAEHALAWGALTGLGLALYPRRWRLVAGFCLALGVTVEILQANMNLGRTGDWRDLVADAVGVLLALRLTQLARRLRRPAKPNPDPHTRLQPESDPDA